MMHSLRWLVQDALNLVLEVACPLCQRSTTHMLCQSCQQQIQRCQQSLTKPVGATAPTVFAWGDYSGKLKQAITALKYENQPQIAQLLGQWLGQAWFAAGAKSYRSQPTVVPIPMHTEKKRERGYDQAELIAQSFCRFTHLPIQSRGLQRVQVTTAQFHLSPNERERNLMNAFAVATNLHHCPTPVLLLDDIYTTGATVRSAIRTLQQHGIQVQGILTVAMAKQMKKS
jgi:ComF family protein